MGIHDLEDLIKKIARNEKIDESSEFAEDIQNSLATRVQKTAKTVKNRGVRKAPFVVLIGADMPSILTEISFLSNPADEQLLEEARTPPARRRRPVPGRSQLPAKPQQRHAEYAAECHSARHLDQSSRRASAKLEQSRNEQ